MQTMTTSHEPIRDRMLYLLDTPGDTVPEYVHRQLREYKDAGIEVVLCCNSNGSKAAEAERLRAAGAVAECRLSPGFTHPFAVLRELLGAAPAEVAENCENLLFSSGQCFGPFVPVAQLLRRRDEADCDFWGISGFRSNGAEIIEPYFFSLRRRVFSTPRLAELLREADADEKMPISARLSRFSALLAGAFTHAAYVTLTDERPIRLMRFEPPYSVNAADHLIREYGMPFLPLAAFNPRRTPRFSICGDIVRALRSRFPDYPESLIADYLKKNCPLSVMKDWPGILQTLPLRSGSAAAPPELRVAVKLHFFYEDSLPVAAASLRNIPCDFDLYCTVCSDRAAEVLREQAAAALPRMRRLEIRKVENRGRDILPWLTAFVEEEAQYDLILKFQVKKRIQQPSVFGQAWYNYNVDCLLGSERLVADIFRMFAEDPALGIVFPSYPPVITATTPGAFQGDETMRQLFRRVRARCATGAPEETGVPVFPAGTIFWYRPAAVGSVFSAGYRTEDFPPEPLPPLTLAHVIERVIPYAVQSAGYYYKMTICEERLLPSYQLLEDRWFFQTAEEKNPGRPAAAPDPDPLYLRGFRTLTKAACKAFAYAVAKHVLPATLRKRIFP